ncbi:MAG: SDR family NAD(P)-dependent oxidoreductase [Halieaceae bacterium]|jgi:3-dehydrosphinganine reductase|nr:SDR family NAD(P)-dependent oxidoreductase [Halieaceae bacterium]
MKTNQCVYITGGSSGIGLALAQHYARSGDKVVLIARDQAKLDGAVTACLDLVDSAQQVIVGISLDVSDLTNLQSKVNTITSEHGQPDLLILSAGTAGNKTFLAMSCEEYEDLMTLNFSASREFARCVLPAMLDRGRGKIAFISSMSGLMGVYGYSAYCASKYAITGFVLALQQELYGTGVSASVICPPEVATPMIAAEADSVLPQTRLLKDLAGTLSPEKAANLIVKGIAKNKPIVITGGVARLFDFTNRVFPGLFRGITRLVIWYASRK